MTKGLVRVLAFGSTNPQSFLTMPLIEFYELIRNEIQFMRIRISIGSKIKQILITGC